LKLKKYILLITAILFLSTTAITSKALAAKRYAYQFTSVRYSIPKSWRGSYTHHHKTMKFNAHSITLNGKTLYKSTWHGHHKLAFATTLAKGQYLINAYAKVGYQSSQSWKLSHKDGKRILINYQNQGHKVVWYRK